MFSQISANETKIYDIKTLELQLSVIMVVDYFWSYAVSGIYKYLQVSTWCQVWVVGLKRNEARLVRSQVG